MDIYRARWIVPIGQPPIENGWVSVENGRVAALGPGRAEWPATDLGDVALLPAFVNAHTHLELSWMAGRVPPAASMPQWVRAMMTDRASAPNAAAIGAAAAAAIASAQASGTAVFGDVTNTLASVPPLEASDAEAVIFRELLGFSAPNPAALVAAAWTDLDAIGALPPLRLPENRDRELFRNNSRSLFSRLHCSVVAHAPYSTSPALFNAIGDAKRTMPLSVHVGESPEEMEFLRTGTGPFRELLERLGAWTTSWTPPACGPIEYLHRCGYLSPGMLAVHGTHLSDADLALLRDSRGVLVTCPRSNVWVGGGAADAARFYRSGVPVALGTDSLASAPNLHMTDELAALRRTANGIGAARLLESATLIGARALGFAADHGSIEAGKRAVFAAVSIPASLAGAADVEEYLVSGDVDASSDVRLVRTN